MSLSEKLLQLDGRTIIAIIFSITFLIISVYACYKGYIKEVLSMLGTFIGMILGYYYGSKTIERWEEE